jgi:hypothetical protein
MGTFGAKEQENFTRVNLSSTIYGKDNAAKRSIENQ